MVRVAPCRLFGLAPAGGYPATTVTSGAVGSYPTVSPLPGYRANPRSGRFVFCGPVRRLAAPRRYLAAYPVELGLSSDTLRHPRPSCPTSGLNIAGEVVSGEAGKWGGREVSVGISGAYRLPRCFTYPACPTRARPRSACCRNGSSAGSARFHCARTWRYCSRASALRPSRS
jgi:hypothetical protein